MPLKKPVVEECSWCHKMSAELAKKKVCPGCNTAFPTFVASGGYSRGYGAVGFNPYDYCVPKNKSLNKEVI